MRGGVPGLQAPDAERQARSRSASGSTADRRRGRPGSSSDRRGSCRRGRCRRSARRRGARNSMPVCVTTPRTRSPSTIRSSTSCWNSVRFGWFSSASGSPACTATRSACARVARTAGPLLAFRVRNWMPARSAALRHRAAERVDFLDQVALADAADRRVAAHLPERLDALRQQQRARAHARRGQGGLGAGMAAAYNDDVEFLGETHGSARFRGARMCKRRTPCRWPRASCARGIAHPRRRL